MPEHIMGTIEYLADELKQLVGWCAHPRRLAALPTLLSVVGTDSDSPGVAGYVARQFLIDGIASFSTPVELEGVAINPEAARTAFRLLLGFESGHVSEPGRRARAIRRLGIERVTVDQWRRPFGLEREYFGLLAEHLVSRAVEPVPS